jgi:hypothetical protein
MGRYNTLRSWAQFLIVFGFLSLILAGFGVIAWAIDVEGFWATMGVIFLGAPLVLFLASWPIAIGEMMRATADIGDTLDTSGAGSRGVGLP